MNYSQKLLDPRWQKKRLKIMERDNFTCTLCKNDKQTLHIHHKSYKGDPWDAPDHFLTTLCESCHSKEHKIEDRVYPYKKLKPSFNSKPRKLLPIHFMMIYLFIPQSVRDGRDRYLNAKQIGGKELEAAKYHFNYVCFQANIWSMFDFIIFGKYSDKPSERNGRR